MLSSPLSLFCLPVGAELLSILDENENGFIWEHIQSYADQAYGAWLGISVKGQAAHSSLCNCRLINLQVLNSGAVFSGLITPSFLINMSDRS